MKNWLFYVLLLFFTLYVTIIYNSPGGVLLTGVVIILPFFLLLILITHTLGIRIAFSMTGQIAERGKIHIPLLAQNKSPFPITSLKLILWFVNQETGEVKKVIRKEAVEAGQELHISLEMPELAAGRWDITIKKIILYDLIGFFCIHKHGKHQEELLVMPQLFKANVLAGDTYTGLVRKGFPEGDVRRENLSGGMDRYHPGQNGDDVSHILDFREYKPGDSIRNIHWKISVKKDELMIKIPGKPINNGIHFHIEYPACTERLLEVIYAISYALCIQNCHFSLVWVSGKSQDTMQIEVFSVEKLYLVMEEFMRQGIHADKNDMGKAEGEMELAGHHIRLDKELCLFYGNFLLAELAEGDLQEKLLEMELII